MLDFRHAPSCARATVYPARMLKVPQECEIVYVTGSAGEGWKWRTVSSARIARSSERSYELFYDCVVAARASGYSPAGVLPVFLKPQ
jgi:hypothetical protein